MPRYVPIWHNAHAPKLLTAIRANDNTGFDRIMAKEGLPTSNNGAELKLLKKSLVYGRARMAKSLLSRGCRAYSEECNGNSPLHLALARRNCGKLVRRLLANGAKVAQKNRKRDTALHLAFAMDNGKVVDIMLEHHLRHSLANETNASGISFLHVAATRPHVDSVWCFLEFGKVAVDVRVDPESDSPYAGSTPLHMAVHYNRLRVAEVLLHYGADIWIDDAQARTPMGLALENKNEPMVDLLFFYEEKRANHAGPSRMVPVYSGNESSTAVCYPLHPTNSMVAPTMQSQYFGNPPLYFAPVVNGNFNLAADQMPIQYFDTAVAGYAPAHFAAEYGHREVPQRPPASGAFDLHLDTFSPRSPSPQFDSGSSDSIRFDLHLYALSPLSSSPQIDSDSSDSVGNLDTFSPRSPSPEIDSGSSASVGYLDTFSPRSPSPQIYSVSSTSNGYLDTFSPRSPSPQIDSGSSASVGNRDPYLPRSPSPQIYSGSSASVGYLDTFSPRSPSPEIYSASSASVGYLDTFSPRSPSPQIYSESSASVGNRDPYLPRSPSPQIYSASSASVGYLDTFSPRSPSPQIDSGSSASVGNRDPYLPRSPSPQIYSGSSASSSCSSDYEDTMIMSMIWDTAYNDDMDCVIVDDDEEVHEVDQVDEIEIDSDEVSEVDSDEDEVSEVDSDEDEVSEVDSDEDKVSEVDSDDDDEVIYVGEVRFN